MYSWQEGKIKPLSLHQCSSQSERVKSKILDPAGSLEKDWQRREIVNPWAEEQASLDTGDTHRLGTLLELHWGQPISDLEKFSSISSSW